MMFKFLQALQLVQLQSAAISTGKLNPFLRRALDSNWVLLLFVVFPNEISTSLCRREFTGTLLCSFIVQGEFFKLLHGNISPTILYM